MINWTHKHTKILYFYKLYAYLMKINEDDKIISKLSRANYAQLDAYRSISLIFFLFKILERIVDRYLRRGMSINHPHELQLAYQSGR